METMIKALNNGSLVVCRDGHLYVGDDRFSLTFCSPKATPGLPDEYTHLVRSRRQDGSIMALPLTAEQAKKIEEHDRQYTAQCREAYKNSKEGRLERLAKQYDAIHNEGGEGYNPYRQELAGFGVDGLDATADM